MKAIEEVYAFLQNANKEAGTFFIATQDGDQPRVRPFGAVDLFNDRIYIQTGKKKNVFQQMMKNPKVEISAFAGGKWIRLSATVVNDDTVEAKKKMLDDNPSLRNIGYNENDENTKVLYLRDATATINSFSDAPKTYQF